MATREEALRRILDSTAGARELTEEQRREILGHLEDAVEAKVGGGTSELQAVAEALEEFGPVDKIARQYPIDAIGVTPEGALALGRGQAYAGAALAAIAVFCSVQLLFAPQVKAAFGGLGVALPLLTVWFVGLGDVMQRYWPALLPLLGVLGWALLRYAGHRPARLASMALAAGTCLLLLVQVAALCLPMISLQQGIR